MNLKTVIDRLAARYGYSSPEDRSALISRVKQAQRMGWPASTKTGRGSKDNWTEESYRDALILCELRHLGFPAQTAIAIASFHRELIIEAYEAKEEAYLHTAVFGGNSTNSAIVLNFTEQ